MFDKEFWCHPKVRGIVALNTIIMAMVLYCADPISQWPWLFAPALLAPFYEWFAHKYLLHLPLPTSGLARELMLQLHYRHHQSPAAIDTIFAPRWAIAIAYIQFYLVFALLCWSWTTALVPLFASGLYYNFYEWVHYQHHNRHYRPRTRWGNQLRTAHMNHHFHNPAYWWGITNILADRILGSAPDDIRNVPRSTDKSLTSCKKSQRRIPL